MSVPSSFTTEKGTELPLINLKGKPYLAIAHRFVWLTELYANYTIDTEFLILDDEESICKATVKIFAEDGKLVKSATATKQESKKDFPAGHYEKSETGSIGRALAMLGIGTQFCTQDMEEGTRLADAPIDVAKKTTSSFNKKKDTTKVVETKVESKIEEGSDAWA